jgi:hypothetical protein
MMFRAIACCTALVLGLLLSIGFAARPADACEGATCPVIAKAKPLDLMKFMHGKTPVKRPVSAYAVKPRHPHEIVRKLAHEQGYGHSIAQRHREHPTAVARTAAAPAPLPAEAATAFASEPDPNVQVVASGELNDIDRAAGPAPAETDGTAMHADQSVQEVDAEAVNNIDSKPTEPAPQLASQSTDSKAMTSTVSWVLAAWSSWSSWIWSSLSDAAVAVRQLFG